MAMAPRVDTPRRVSGESRVARARAPILGCERKMIDELRCRNGNLEIAITHQEVSNDEI